MSTISRTRLLAGLAVAGLALAGFAAAAGAFTPQPRAAADVQPLIAPVPTAPAPVVPPVAAPVPATATAIGPVPTGLPDAARLAAAGIHDPVGIEREHGRIEIEHRDAGGRRVETWLDPATGAVIRREVDDSHRDGRHDREDRDHD